MTLNPHYALNSVLRQYLWLSATRILVANVVGELLTEKNSCNTVTFYTLPPPSTASQN